MTTTAWGEATLVEEITIKQTAVGRSFASVRRWGCMKRSARFPQHGEEGTYCPTSLRPAPSKAWNGILFAALVA